MSQVYKSKPISVVQDKNIRHDGLRFPAVKKLKKQKSKGNKSQRWE